MIPVYSMTDTHDGYAVVEVEINKMISNAVTLYIAGNQRPARITDIPTQTVEFVIRAGLKNAQYWTEAIDPDQQAEEIWDVRTLLGKLHPEVRALIQWLQRERVDVVNLGTCHREALLTKGGSYTWKPKYMVAPGLGYPREYLEYGIDLPLKNYTTKPKNGGKGRRIYGDHRLPHPQSNWNVGIAATTLTLDRDRMTAKLVPDLEVYNGLSTKSIPFGALQKVAGQGKHLFALMMLLCCQGLGLIARANYRRLKAEWDLTIAKDPQAKDELELFMMGVERAREIPLHPIWSVIGSILNTGTLKSFYGDRETLWRVGPRANPNGKVGEGMCPHKMSDMRAVMLAVAQEDYISLKDDASCIRTRWDFDTTSGHSEGMISYAELYRTLAASEHITALWPEIVRILGWSEISADAGVTDAFGADFTITDGDRATDDLMACALGLRPLVSMGNFKVAGLANRTNDQWNLGSSRAELNVIPIPGEASVVPENKHVEQMAIPAGMWMGEENVHAHTADGFLNSSMGKLIVEYWFETQSEYWDRYYHDPSVLGVVPTKPVRETAWDPEGISSGKASDLATAWKESGKGQVTGSLLIPYMLREGQKLRLRAPAVMARKNSWEYYNQFGAYLDDMPFEGHVMFNGEINFRSGTDGSLMAMIDSGPSAAVSGTAELEEALKT